MSELTPSQQAALARTAVLEKRIVAEPNVFRALSGDRSTGPLHIGHYFGTLANRVRLQYLGVEVMVLIADYQVMTDHQTSQELPAIVRGITADYLAAGIDPARSVVFTHSAVPGLNELVLPFLSLVSDAELHRNPTVKAEIEATGRPPTGLMLTYPVHQAADILFCRANLVPVGLDQLPHLETTRLIARRFNDRYTDTPLFPEPDALLTDTPMLMGLDGQKMSKTRGNGIALQATEDQTAAMIRRAPTDSDRHITYDPAGRPAVANLLDLLAAATAGHLAGSRRDHQRRRRRPAQADPDRRAQRTPTTAKTTPSRVRRGPRLPQRRPRRREPTSTTTRPRYPHPGTRGPRHELLEPVSERQHSSLRPSSN